MQMCRERRDRHTPVVLRTLRWGQLGLRHGRMEGAEGMVGTEGVGTERIVG